MLHTCQSNQGHSYQPHAYVLFKSYNHIHTCMHGQLHTCSHCSTTPHTIAAWPLPRDFMHLSCTFLSSLAFDDLPDSNQLTHVQEMGDPVYPINLSNTVNPNPSTSLPVERHQPPILISNSLPPVRTSQTGETSGGRAVRRDV